jgi:hypothetical protein
MEKKYFRKKGKCECKNCGIEFEKPLSEIIRNEKLNRPNFCSRTCVGKNNSKNLGLHLGDYNKIVGYKRTEDEFSKFRYHYRNAKKRNHDLGITMDDLKKQWELQKGKCFFSGVELKLSTHTKINNNPIYAASLDRIDSSKGYIPENIRWVSRAMNWMKNTMSDDMVEELLQIIVEYKKTPN